MRDVLTLVRNFELVFMEGLFREGDVEVGVVEVTENDWLKEELRWIHIECLQSALVKTFRGIVV